MPELARALPRLCYTSGGERHSRNSAAIWAFPERVEATDTPTPGRTHIELMRRGVRDDVRHLCCKRTGAKQEGTEHGSAKCMPAHDGSEGPLQLGRETQAQNRSHPARRHRQQQGPAKLVIRIARGLHGNAA
ncbi:MAG: hypothetical protein JWN41_291 [Thermoleophilia bacterium]|nr:hypothetical protein [Thermoleophilia bacterium]